MLIPKNRHEYYLAVISGNDYPTFPPKIREEQYLAKLAGREVDVPTPRTPKERAYYNIINDIKFEPENRWQTFVAAANDDSITAPIPRTREEIWWANISLSHEVIVEYIGTLPTTLQTVEGYLESYKIYGNAEQNGTPTPENPIAPSGCGERTENFWNFQPSTEQSGVTLTWNGAKIVFSGICTLSSNLTKSITLSAGTYTIKANANRIPVKDDNSCVDVYKASPYMMAKIANRNAINGIAQFTLGEETTVILRIRVQADVNYDGFTLEPMLNLGSTTLPYEPYGYKLPILSNSAVTNIYLGEVETTRRIRKLVLTGKEGITQHSIVNNIVGVRIPTPTVVAAGSPIICTHATNVSWANYYGFRTYAMVASNASAGNLIVYMSAPDSEHNTLSDIKSYLAQQYANGTPVTIWYILVELETGIVNEPLMKIGNYTDTIDSTQSTVQIPTAAGSTTISWAGEGLAPSEVELTYKTIKKSYISADDKVYQDPNGQLLGG